MSPSPAPSSYPRIRPTNATARPTGFTCNGAKSSRPGPTRRPCVISDRHLRSRAGAVPRRSGGPVRRSPAIPDAVYAGECGREGRPLNLSAAECRACLWADNPLHHRNDAEDHQHQRPGDTHGDRTGVTNLDSPSFTLDVRKPFRVLRIV